MKIKVVSTCYNEVSMLPFYLRHYEVFADEIVVYDDKSTDGSKEILLGHPQVRVEPCHWSGLDDQWMLDLWYAEIKASIGKCDWLMFPDIDELLVAPNGMRETLSVLGRAYGVIATKAFNMVGEGLPPDDGRQLWEIMNNGIYAPVYSKANILKPGTQIDWHRGKHQFHSCSVPVSPPAVKLLHYRYLGGEYTRIHNAKNYERCTGDKACAWSNAPGYDGEHSAKWAESIKAVVNNVLLEPL